MTTNDELLYEIADGIATITINRPDSRNALNSAVRNGDR
jgi:enoyl-CoA hydratase/carnithine racemase